MVPPHLREFPNKLTLDKEMKMIKDWRISCSGSILTLLLFGILGCGSSDSQKSQAKDKGGKESANQSAQSKVKEEAGDSKHSGWWCDEHGVPESECSACNAKVAAEFKKKGDWCDKHDRAMSQCFVGNPKAKGRYAAIYRAKEGKEPPPIVDEEKK
jgi:hypothetical protein